MKNLLFISNISYRINAFSKAAIEASHKVNLRFHYAANWNDAGLAQVRQDEDKYDIRIHHVDICRSPLSPRNRDALKQVREIVLSEKINFIHCNTPVGGVIGRFLNKEIEKVIYEAHGFHFYKGAPIINWLIYYPIEKILARRTDAIITINQDDFEFAKKHMRSKVYYVPGVGIELEQWNNYRDIREEQGIKANDFVILVVGRLEQNKNCGTIINAVSRVADVKLVFCGDGEDRKMLEEQASKLGIRERTLFLGNRNDMPDVYHMADCFVMASYREGLSRSIMEAMACGLPCIVSNIRGNRDLIDEQGGYLFKPTDVDGLAERISFLKDSDELRKRMSAHNLEKIKEFSFDRVVNDLTKIYTEVFELGKAP